MPRSCSSISPYVPLYSASLWPKSVCRLTLRQISWGRRACRECGGQRPGRERKPACHAGGLPKPGAVSLGNCSADAKATAAAKRREFWLKCDTFDQKNSRAGVASNNGWRASLNFFRRGGLAFVPRRACTARMRLPGGGGLRFPRLLLFFDHRRPEARRACPLSLA